MLKNQFIMEFFQHVNVNIHLQSGHSGNMGSNGTEKKSFFLDNKLIDDIVKVLMFLYFSRANWMHCVYF